MGHRFFHPAHLLEPHGDGWLMLEHDEVLGAIVCEDDGRFVAFAKRGGQAVPVDGRATSRDRAAVTLWNATHPVRWGDRG
jgi:hypothetical protein